MKWAWEIPTKLWFYPSIKLENTNNLEDRRGKQRCYGSISGHSTELASQPSDSPPLIWPFMPRGWWYRLAIAYAPRWLGRYRRMTDSIFSSDSQPIMLIHRAGQSCHRAEWESDNSSSRKAASATFYCGLARGEAEDAGQKGVQQNPGGNFCEALRERQRRSSLNQFAPRCWVIFWVLEPKHRQATVIVRRQQ